MVLDILLLAVVFAFFAIILLSYARYWERNNPVRKEDSGSEQRSKTRKRSDE